MSVLIHPKVLTEFGMCLLTRNKLARGLVDWEQSGVDYWDFYSKSIDVIGSDAQVLS